MARNARHTLPPAVQEVDSGLAPRALTKQEFGRRLQSLMLERGWNQSELARQADIGRDAVSTYIRGRSFPEPKSLHALAEALGVEVSELLPNSAMAAIDADVAPMLEIRQAQGHPEKVWLRVNRMTSLRQAAEIFEILRRDE